MAERFFFRVYGMIDTTSLEKLKSPKPKLPLSNIPRGILIPILIFTPYPPTIHLPHLNPPTFDSTPDPPHVFHGISTLSYELGMFNKTEKRGKIKKLSSEKQAIYGPFFLLPEFLFIRNLPLLCLKKVLWLLRDLLP